MTSLKVGGGQVRITEKTIQIDLGPIKALKRLYEYNKLIIAFLIVGSLYMINMAFFESSPLRELAQFAIIFGLISIPLSILYPRMRDNIGTASEISRTIVDHVEYTTGSRVFVPQLHIIVDDGVVTGVRSVPLSHRQLGGDKQLENAIRAFEEAGIDIVPADDTPGEDS